MGLLGITCSWHAISRMEREIDFKESTKQAIDYWDAMAHKLQPLSETKTLHPEYGFRHSPDIEYMFYHMRKL